MIVVRAVERRSWRGDRLRLLLGLMVQVRGGDIAEQLG